MKRRLNAGKMPGTATIIMIITTIITTMIMVITITRIMTMTILTHIRTHRSARMRRA